MTRKNLKEIEKKIANIKKKLALIAEMRPGSLTKQYKDPKNKKGAYYQLSFTHKMKSKTEYIRPVFLKKITQEIKVW